MKHCTSCLLPETHETITFDRIANVAFVKILILSKKVNWKRKKTQLDKIISKFKGKYEYDCIVPFSGEKIVRGPYII